MPSSVNPFTGNDLPDINTQLCYDSPDNVLEISIGCLALIPTGLEDQAESLFRNVVFERFDGWLIFN